MNQRIRDLQAQIKAEKNLMSYCTHELNEAFYNRSNEVINNHALSR